MPEPGPESIEAPNSKHGATMAPAEVFAAINDRAATGPIVDDPLGPRSHRALVDLSAAPRAQPAFGAWVQGLSRQPQYEDAWHRAADIAASAKQGDATSIGVALLIGEHNASGASESPLALAMALVTTVIYGVSENGLGSAARAELLSQARAVLGSGAEALGAFLRAQHRATGELFLGADRLLLFRGERRQVVATDPEIELVLRPLSSWTTSPEIALGMADAFDAAEGGPHRLLLTAAVPKYRILSTFATGIGSPSELEVVLTGGRPSDRCAASNA